MRHIGFHEIDTIIYFSKSFLVIKQGVVLVSVTYREGSFLRQYLFMGRAFGVPLLSFTLVRRCVSMLCVCLCLWLFCVCVGTMCARLVHVMEQGVCADVIFGTRKRKMQDSSIAM